MKEKTDLLSIILCSVLGDKNFKEWRKMLMRLFKLEKEYELLIAEDAWASVRNDRQKIAEIAKRKAENRREYNEIYGKLSGRKRSSARRAAKDGKGGRK